MSDERALTRRSLLVGLTGITGVALAGCLEDDGVSLDGNPQFEDGEVGDVDGDPRSAEEMTAAESVAEQDTHEGVTRVQSLGLEDHEFVLEDDYLGSTVQGTVENTDSSRIELAEVRVRVYNDAGDQIGRYLASTGDLAAETTWEFQVVILEDPADIADYDITVVGTPT
ncbi:FxLYD domain-containing protein [Natronolimnobius baerhuensis]|uniref:DUF3426 domain-containing protein n=1 Tax=Natronolimnobius baerhuensis TaxID=253108 RepID=A0A202E6T4_9EURY|nr:FxLYD domain-containing protein [Natronolimnobius baerhuensis]OVE83962.1 hypothetical protein B2G88_16275 [Natronolimnobius baerhuensis]